jgi:hypothetical protein
VRGVDDPAVDGVEHLEGAHHGAGRRHLPLEAAARHVLHHLGKLEGGDVQEVGGGPGALHLPDELRLRGGVAGAAPKDRREDQHTGRAKAIQAMTMFLGFMAPPPSRGYLPKR